MDVKTQTHANQNHFATHNQIKIVETGKQYAIVQMSITDNHLNPGGVAHGGSIFTMADIAAGSALIYQNQKFTTLNGSINYLKPGILNSTLTARADIVREGGSTAVIDVIIKDEKDTLIATAHFTFYKFKE